MRDKTKEIWLTTVDNPFDPFTQWDRWLNFDEQNNYRTCGRIAAIAHCNSENLSPYENKELVNNAINFLYNFYGDKVYRIVVEGETKAW